MVYIGIVGCVSGELGVNIPGDTENPPHNLKFDADLAAVVTDVSKP